MILPADRVSLPAGVAVVDGMLLDPVRQQPIPLNRTGELVVGRADGRTLADLASALAEATGVEPERALADTQDFCRELNRTLLLNVARARSSAWATVWLLGYGLGQPALARRGGLRTLATPAAILAAAGALALLPLAAAAGDATLLLPGLALAAGLLVHEAGHAGALRGVPWCVGVAGLRVAILHRPLPPARRAAVAAAGPAAAAVTGLLLLAAAWLAEALWLALASGPLALQALGLTVLGGDGRTACGLS